MDWHAKHLINKEFKIFRRLKIKFSIRSKNAYMGRFGGGWNFKIGVQASDWKYILISLVVAEIIIDSRKVAR